MVITFATTLVFSEMTHINIRYGNLTCLVGLGECGPAPSRRTWTCS